MSNRKSFISFLERHVMSKSSIFIITTLFFVFLTIIILITTFIHDWISQAHLGKIKYETLGNIGDFSAGVLGTILSMIGALLVIRTMEAQSNLSNQQAQQNHEIATETKKLTLNGQELNKIEQFKDIFFEMLNIYKGHVQSFEIEGHTGNNKEKRIYQGKEGLEYLVDSLRNSYKPGAKLLGVDSGAQSSFLEFYIENQRFLGAYFRTIYRIYDLLEHADIPTDVKRDYLKIIRAQLSGPELILIRYNGATEYGKPFQNYINKYNILKHLNVTDLLEFLTWKPKFTDTELMGINIIFHRLRRDLSKCINLGVKQIDHRQDANISKKYTYIINNVKPGKKVKIVFIIDSTHNNTQKELSFLNDLSTDDIEILLKLFTRELFIYRNYRQFNNPKNLIVKTVVDKINDKRTTIICTISSTGKHTLRLHHPDLDDVYPASKSMKIGILTQPLTNNYGGILQNYALQEILRKMGHEPCTLNIKRDWAKDSFSFHTIASYMKRFVEIYLMGNPKKHLYLSSTKTVNFCNTPQKHQKRFINKYIHLLDVSVEGIKAEADNFEAFIVGSDQVWRPQFSNNLPRYFLDFVTNPDTKRIAYGASFGVDKWESTEELTSICRPLAQKFNAVSVREKSGIKLCKMHLNIDAIQVLDPTLLLDAKDYRKLYKSYDESDPHKPYIAVYVLDMTPNIKRIIKKLSSCYKLPIIHIGEYKPGKIPSIESWLKGIDNAEFVITDSFHGSVFSIIFEKNFVYVGNINRGNDRLNSLFDIFKIQRFADTFEYAFTILQKGPGKIPDNLKTLQHKSLQFLNSALHTY